MNKYFWPLLVLFYDDNKIKKARKPGKKHHSSKGRSYIYHIMLYIQWGAKLYNTLMKSRDFIFLDHAELNNFDHI